MKVILCGYNWTGCKALQLLLEEGHEVFVYTHETEQCCPDLVHFCEKNDISYSLEKISINNMPFVPDVICSIYYRYIIGKDVIEAVNGKIFNLHPALLPKYRGCSSLTWAMINGETQCGYTYHYIDAGCDTGDIIIQKPISIEMFDTQLSLYNRVMFESMKDFKTALQQVVNKRPGKKQVGEPTMYKRGCPYNGEIQEEWTGEMQERFIRAMIYPPYPAATYQNQIVRTWKEFEQLKERKDKNI